MDQYLSLLLLFMFNPICQSLRGLQQARLQPGRLYVIDRGYAEYALFQASSIRPGGRSRRSSARSSTCWAAGT